MFANCMTDRHRTGNNRVNRFELYGMPGHRLSHRLTGNVRLCSTMLESQTTDGRLNCLLFRLFLSLILIIIDQKLLF